jgi:hypothetical protein
MYNRERTSDEQPEAESVTDEPPAVATVVKTVEDWASAKGMLPAMTGGTVIRIPGALRNHPAVGVQLGMEGAVPPAPNPEFVKFAAAKAMFKWPEGRTLTEQEFDDAVHAAYGGCTSR